MVRHCRPRLASLALVGARVEQQSKVDCLGVAGFIEGPDSASRQGSFFAELSERPEARDAYLNKMLLQAVEDLLEDALGLSRDSSERGKDPWWWFRRHPLTISLFDKFHVSSDVSNPGRSVDLLNLKGDWTFVARRHRPSARSWECGTVFSGQRGVAWSRRAKARIVGLHTLLRNLISPRLRTASFFCFPHGATDARAVGACFKRSRGTVGGSAGRGGPGPPPLSSRPLSVRERQTTGRVSCPQRLAPTAKRRMADAHRRVTT